MVYNQHSLLSDEFNKPCNIDDWYNINETEGWGAEQLELHDVAITNDDKLTMMPYTSSWFADYRGILLFKNISGDFIFETSVEASNRAGAGLPSSQYSLSGLMIRTPKSLTTGATDWTGGQENYVFLAMGFAATNHPSCSGCAGPHFEVKNTINSNSNLTISSIESLNVIIRMVRINGVVLVLRRTPATPFVVHARFDRSSNMPDSVQVGMVTYTDWPNVSMYDYETQNANVLNDDFDNTVSWNPDLIAQFEYARFDDVVVPQHLQGLNFYNEVADTAIINNFGYDLFPQAPWYGKIWKGSDSDWTNSSNWTGGTIPIATDSLLIPDCLCLDIACPEIPAGSYNYRTMVVEEEGSVTVNVGATLNIDLTNPSWRFFNEGTIINNGTISINSPSGSEVINEGNITNNAGSTFQINN